MNKTIGENIKAVIFGHAVADALGGPAEFRDREMLMRNPITGMVGYGTYNVPRGTWSDDTSMSLATLDSLAFGEIDKNKKFYDHAHDSLSEVQLAFLIMYITWYRASGPDMRYEFTLNDCLKKYLLALKKRHEETVESAKKYNKTQERR